MTPEESLAHAEQLAADYRKRAGDTGNTKERTMNAFKVGDRVKVVNHRSHFCGQHGTITPYGVTLDSEGEMWFSWDELRLLPPKSKPPITRDEWNDQINQYESQIDQLNEVLDEIRDALPEGDDLTWYDGECAYACSKIGQIIDKRPVQP